MSAILSMRKKISASFQFGTDGRTLTIWRAWYNGSYSLIGKPIKMLELHYPMIQCLIIYIMTQSEFERHYDPEMGRCVEKHIIIYGEGISDVFKLIAK